MVENYTSLSNFHANGGAMLKTVTLCTVLLLAAMGCDTTGPMLDGSADDTGSLGRMRPVPDIRAEDRHGGCKDWRNCDDEGSDEATDGPLRNDMP